jgi:hypothetical protein
LVFVMPQAFAVRYVFGDELPDLVVGLHVDRYCCEVRYKLVCWDLGVDALRDRCKVSLQVLWMCICTELHWCSLMCEDC